MKPRRVNVTYQKDAGFHLIVEEFSGFRSALTTAADWVCARTGHRFCNSFFAYFEEKDYKAAKVLVTVPITREQAESVAFSDDSWSWLDD